jgi:SAM-dependent methyltransferase
MSYLGAKLFTWVHKADFYQDLHRQALSTIPDGASELWFDIGCGPGVLTRLAAAKGYLATGIDLDPAMIAAAKRIALKEDSPAQFRVGSISSVPTGTAAVVSAASLLAVLPDKKLGFQTLVDMLQSGGLLVVIEPTHLMNLHNANMLIQRGVVTGRGLNALRLWSWMRSGAAVDPSVLVSPDITQISCTPLLGGMVLVWIFQKNL